MSTTTITEIREKVFKSPLDSVHTFFTLNLRGGTRASDDLEDDGRFILDNTSWLRLQLYIQAGRKLPTDNVTLKVSFGDQIEEALGTATTEFLLTTYSSIHDHCSYFALKTFPGVVSLANTVVNYAKDTETYYPAIDQLFSVLLDKTKPESAREQAASDLIDIFDGLEARTNSKSVEVQQMTDEIHTTEADGIQVETLTENVSSLGVTSDTKIENLRQQVEYKKEEIKKANDDYLRHLKTARETAYYIWYPIYGWIAGLIVSGNANAAAKQALEDMKTAQRELEVLQKDLENARLLAQSITNSDEASQEIGGLIQEALEDLATMDSAWQKMSKDFTDISDKLSTWQTAESLNILAKLDFVTMQERWKDIGDAAKDYTTRAFMVVVDT